MKIDSACDGTNRCSELEADIVLIVGQDGAIQEMDESAGASTEFSASALISTSLFGHIHQLDLMPVFRGVEELVEGREVEVQLGFHLRTAAGIWRAVRGTMRRCGDGRATAGLMLTLQLLSSVG